MKKLLKNKRGLAIESAILFMLIVFMFGFLLTGVAMVSHLRVKVNDTLLKREMEIEQIGEDFVRMNEQQFEYMIGSFNGKYNYTAIFTDDKNKTLTLKNSTATLLHITIEDGKITSWIYSDKGN